MSTALLFILSPCRRILYMLFNFTCLSLSVCLRHSVKQVLNRPFCFCRFVSIPVCLVFICFYRSVSVVLYLPVCLYTVLYLSLSISLSFCLQQYVPVVLQFCSIFLHCLSTVKYFNRSINVHTWALAKIIFVYWYPCCVNCLGAAAAGELAPAGEILYRPI